MVRVGSSFADRRDLAAGVALDNLADRLNLPRLDPIKAGIEDRELRVMKGAAPSIDGFRPCLMLQLMDRFLNRRVIASTPRSVSWIRLSVGR